VGFFSCTKVSFHVFGVIQCAAAVARVSRPLLWVSLHVHSSLLTSLVCTPLLFNRCRSTFVSFVGLISFAWVPFDMIGVFQCAAAVAGVSKSLLWVSLHDAGLF